MKQEQAKALKAVQVYSFAELEAVLYLDGHPEDARALEYYHRTQDKLRCAVTHYEEQYGPLTSGGVQSTDRWTWVADPWPWEYEAR